METAKKVASGAVESIRNSPLFWRKLCTYQKAATQSNSEEGEGERSGDRVMVVRGVESLVPLSPTLTVQTFTLSHPTLTPSHHSPSHPHPTPSP